MTTDLSPDRPPFFMGFFDRMLVRYAIAVVVVGLGFLLRLPFAGDFGSRLPYVTLSPAVMLAAVLGGFGPGLLATILAALGTLYWILPPIGQFTIENPSDVIGLALFMGMGVFMSAVAALYRETRDRAAAHDREQAVRETEERIRTIASALPPSTRAARTQPRPPEPLGQFRRRLALDVAFAVALVLLASVGAASYRTMIAAREAERWEMSTYAVIAELDDLLQSLQGVETVQRGFLITGDPQFLKSYAGVLGQMDRHLAALRSLTGDNPRQQQRLDTIEPLIRGKLAELQESIVVRSTHGLQAASEVMMTGRGERIMDQVRSQLEQAQKEEAQLLKNQAAEKEASVNSTFRWVVLGAALGGILLVVVFVFFRFEFDRRHRGERELRVYQDHLLELVETRTRELRESEEQLRVTLTSIGDAVMVSDAESRVTFLNPVAVALTGWRPEEAQGQPVQRVFEIINGQTREPAADIVGCVLREKRIVALANHTTLVAKDGREFPIEDSAAPILDAAGNVTGVVLVFHDVTEKRRAQEALHAARDHLDSLLNHANAPIIVWDPTYHITRFNHAFERLTGRTAAEVLGKTLDILFPAETRKASMDLIDRIAAGEGLEVAEISIQHISGAVRMVLWNSATLYERDGRTPAATIAQGQDITERKHQEEQLRKLNRTLQALSDSSQAMMRATDETAFLQDVCRLIVEGCGHAMVWIGFAEEDEARSVRVAASAGFEAGYLETLKLSWADTERGRGPTGTAIRTAIPSRCSNMRTDPRFAPWREQALKRGYASSLALPLLAAGKAFGAITIYSRELDAFTDEEVKLLSGLADDLAYGIVALRLRLEGRQAEKALRENEARLRALTEHTPAFICEIDRQGFVQFASQGLAGVPRGQMVGTNALSWIPETQRLGISETITRVFRTAEAVTTEYNTADGRTYLATFSPIIIGGETVVLALTAIDITDRKRAEEALEQARLDLERKVNERTFQLREYNSQLISEIAIRREKEAELREAEFRYRTVAEFTQDWEYWETPEHTLRYCSPSCEGITGYASHELIADPELMQRMVHPEDVGVWRDHRHDALTALKPGIVQFRIRRKDGGIRWLEHACQPVLAEDGAFLGIRAGNRDITERREAELQTQRLRNELAHVARVITLGQLAASLAHELNQPLGAILCNAEAAQSLLDSGRSNLEEVRRALGDIIEDDQRAGQVIRRLRALFRKEAVEGQPLNVNDLVRETLALLRSELILKSISAQLDLAPELPPVIGGRVELQQVLMNLVLNAVDAMANRESGRRNVRIATSVDGPRSVRVSVSDSGAGLPAELIAERWEPFFTTKPTGMGMGLSISRSIIESHGGRLWAVNNPDQGATFYFTLPVPDGGSA
jgi:PAS domain S-box-containing protein